VLGPEVDALLLQFPNVIAFVNGHTHVNRITPHARPGGGGYWEISTAAHVDYPCQARLLEVVDNRDGTLSIFGTVIDAAAPLSYAGRLDGPQSLASLGRELAANDWQERTDARRGRVEDRNVELLLRAPFALSVTAPVARPPATVPPPATGQLPTTGPELAGTAAAAAAVAAGLALRWSRRTEAVAEARGSEAVAE
jgi:hypothetical protein